MKQIKIILRYGEQYLKDMFPNGFIISLLTWNNDSSHENLIAIEKNNNMIFKRKNCNYTQNFIPLWVLDILKRTENKNE